MHRLVRVSAFLSNDHEQALNLPEWIHRMNESTAGRNLKREIHTLQRILYREIFLQKFQLTT